MNKLKEVCGAITGPDLDIIEKTQDHLNHLTKPVASLGRLEELAVQIAGITSCQTPQLHTKTIFTFAADHGVTEEGISAFPKEVTPQMVYNFLKGGAAINVLAKHAGAKVVIADLGVACDLKPHPNLIVEKINYGTKNMAKEPAMSRQEALQSIHSGIKIFEDQLKQGLDILGTGEMGIGNTTASSAITTVLTKKHAEEVTGKGTGLDEKGLNKKIEVIKKAININKPNAADPIDVLSKVGGFEIGALAGVILAASSKKIPVVIDGFISGAAALLAFHLAPPSKNYMIASHCSVEIGHKAILSHIGLKPILDLNLRLGEGTGAALGMTIIEAALKILTQMATFQEANVSEGKN
ncbi:MAG: nicotinate-nucleotide--dimethylbenzimidazole phosphoribosyltransferase [Candidatus Omnitrophota bacterium]